MAALDLLVKVDTESFRGVAESIVESAAYFAPEFIIAVTALGVLLADLFLPRRSSRHLAWVAVFGCVLASLTLPAPQEESSRLFAGMVAFDGFANFYKLFFLLGAVPVVVLSFLSLELDGRRMGERHHGRPGKRERPDDRVPGLQRQRRLVRRPTGRQLGRDADLHSGGERVRGRDD